MKLRVPLLLAFATSVLLCSLPLRAQNEDPLLNSPLMRKPLQALTPSKRGVVFKAPEAREFGRQCSRESPMGWWSSVAPSKAEIRALEAALPGWIKAHQLKNWKGSFEQSYYQYGALVRGGKRLIYVNALPREDSFAGKAQVWRRVPEIVCDGGPRFWGVEYDVAAKRFQNVSYNGPA